MNSSRNDSLAVNHSARENFASRGSSVCKYSDHLIIFARLPEPGRTKTRLIPALGSDKAASVYSYLAGQTIQLAQQLKQRLPLNVTVHFTGGSVHELQAAFGDNLDYQLQQGVTLGERLQHATSSAFECGARRVIVIGTDCPELCLEDLEQAYASLKSSDVVIGPALDGGYYLIGLTKNWTELFDEIEWSTDQVYRQTTNRARSLRLGLSSLRTLSDVDFPEDLLSLRRTFLTSNKALFPTEQGRLSVIIPTINEADCLPSTLDAIGIPDDDLEIVVVDAGSTDSTLKIALDFGCTAFTCQRGRARQMNAGAAIASGDQLLFLHADTMLPADYRKEIHKVLETRVACGAFPLEIDARGLGLRLIESGVAFRSRFLQMPYGDQAQFFRSGDFYEQSGFKQIAIMEDYEIIVRMRKHGRIGLANRPVKTSARRWIKKGILRTTVMNQICVIAYRLGFSDKTIAEFYRGNRQISGRT